MHQKGIKTSILSSQFQKLMLITKVYTTQVKISCATRAQEKN